MSAFLLKFVFHFGSITFVLCFQIQKISRNLLLNSAKSLFPVIDSSFVAKNEPNVSSVNGTSLLQMALKRKRPLFDSENEHLLKRQFFLTTASSSKLGQRFLCVKTESSAHPNLTQLLLNKSQIEENQNKSDKK